MRHSSSPAAAVAASADEDEDAVAAAAAVPADAARNAVVCGSRWENKGCWDVSRHRSMTCSSKNGGHKREDEKP